MATIQCCPSASRVEDLEKRVEDLQHYISSQRNDNVLCDCISEVYVQVLEHVCSNHPHIRALSWASLMRLAKRNPEIKEYIQTAYREFGFEDLEWQALRNFKDVRNTNHHNLDLSEAYNILHNQLADDFPPLLREALLKTVGLCE